MNSDGIFAVGGGSGGGGRGRGGSGGAGAGGTSPIFCLETTLNMLEIPYGDCFEVNMRWDVEACQVDGECDSSSNRSSNRSDHTTSITGSTSTNIRNNSTATAVRSICRGKGRRAALMVNILVVVMVVIVAVRVVRVVLVVTMVRWDVEVSCVDGQCSAR